MPNNNITNGTNGGNYYADTSAHVAANGTGPWDCIEAVGDTTFTTLSGRVPIGYAGTATLKDGRRLFGHFTTITLASGAVIAYKAQNL